MSDLTSEVQGLMLEALTSLRDLSAANARADELLAAEIERVWADNAALRDDLHALANRVEAVTRGI